MKKWLDSSSSSDDESSAARPHSHPLAANAKEARRHVDATRRQNLSDADDSGDDVAQITPLQVSRQSAKFPAGNKFSNSPARNSGKLSPRAASLSAAIAPAVTQKIQPPAGNAPPAGASQTSVPGPSPVAGNAATTPLSPASGSQATVKISIGMEYGDEYVGEAIPVADGKDQFIPHGRGTLQSPIGKHCYVGDFEHRLRDGYGKLVTERFVLWARWRANRPDLGTSARVDYPNGDKYSGYLDMTQDQQMANALLKLSPQVLSNFSIWVRTATVTRERWGEAVLTSSGSRYFGQWERNIPQGFGCYFGPTGDRYIGMFVAGKFCGSGTLFTSSSTTTSTTSGISPIELGLAPSNLSFSASAANAASSAVPPMQAGGTVYDGVWEAGLFAGEDGHIIFPCHTRVTADWINACHGLRGQVVFSSGAMNRDRPKLIATFQWEPLLLSSKDGLAKMEPGAASSLRSAVMAAKSRYLLEDVVKKALKSTPVVVNACKIFRRCFFFLYGTCGNPAEIGSGGATPTSTGWCHARHAYGGCIHPGKGKRIDASDTVAALGDIHSFIGTAKRWLYEAMGTTCVERITGELDAENVVSRAVLDVLMNDVHAPLMNLYSQAYAREEVQLAYAVRRLRQTTLDDFGVSFGRNESEKLFDPYADAVRSVERLPQALSLSVKLAVLSKWSKDIDLSTKLSQVKLQEEHLLKISSFVRERSGTVVNSTQNQRQNRKPGSGGGSDVGNDSFTSPMSARSHTEQFFDSYEQQSSHTNSDRLRAATVVAQSAVVVGNASNSMRHLSTPPTSLAPASLAGDDALEAALQKLHQEETAPEHLVLPHAHADQPTATTASSSMSTKNLLQQVLQVESGSADDLLPIHQYVLCKATVPALYANTKLLVDLSSDDSFVDPTSQDCFCITTLQACVSIIPELFVDVRDPQNVITSVSMYEKRVEDFVSSIRDRAAFRLVVDVVPQLLDALSTLPLGPYIPATPHASTMANDAGNASGSESSSLPISPATPAPSSSAKAHQGGHQFVEVPIGDLSGEAIGAVDDAILLGSAKSRKVWRALCGTLHCVLVEVVYLNAATNEYEVLSIPDSDVGGVSLCGAEYQLLGRSLALRVPVRMHGSVFRSAAVLIDSFRT